MTRCQLSIVDEQVPADCQFCRHLESAKEEAISVALLSAIKAWIETTGLIVKMPDHFWKDGALGKAALDHLVLRGGPDLDDKKDASADEVELQAADGKSYPVKSTDVPNAKPCGYTQSRPVTG